MPRSPTLADELVAALPADCSPPTAPAELEPAVQRLIERALPGWAEVREHAVDFVRFVAGKLQPDRPIDAQLADLHAADLALAWACAADRPGAVATFESAFAPSMRAVAERYAADDADAQDIVQGIRERLLGRGGASKIADYRGAGALQKWVQVTIRRAGLDHLRAAGRRPEIASDDERLDERVGELDPELEYMKDAYRGAFEQALGEALRALAPRQRNVLRHRLVYGVQIEEIAAIYHVNRKTITRWMSAAQEQLLESVRAALRERLRLPPEELTSLMRLVHSRLDFSLSTALRSGS